MAKHLVAALALLLSPILGCRSRPNDIVTIQSPSAAVFYTKETSHGEGPVSNDYTRVYAHFSHDGKTAKIDVISGEYIEGSSIIWTSPTDVDICLKAGITDTFRNEVTLNAGDTPDSYITIHNHLKEQC